MRPPPAHKNPLVLLLQLLPSLPAYLSFSISFLPSLSFRIGRVYFVKNYTIKVCHDIVLLFTAQEGFQVNKGWNDTEALSRWGSGQGWEQAETRVSGGIFILICPHGSHHPPYHLYIYSIWPFLLILLIPLSSFLSTSPLFPYPPWIPCRHEQPDPGHPGCPPGCRAGTGPYVIPKDEILKLIYLQVRVYFTVQKGPTNLCLT